jgi:type I site-specific restriction endonuclease
MMQEKLLYAYEEKSLGRKTLIFNNGIKTSKYVKETFAKAGYPIRHLDNTTSDQERREILHWFKNKKDAILTSVGILTTGFDEPTVETIILNRATRSLTLYHQMIGRGSRILPNKSEFTVIDLGNNAQRFGLWDSDVDWESIFHSPDFYYDSLVSDEELEKNLKYELPLAIKERFSKSDTIDFDIKAAYKRVTAERLRPKVTLDNSIEQHAKICAENAESAFEAIQLSKLLEEDIQNRIRQYSHCICKSSANYLKWLEDEYVKKLKDMIRRKF